MHQRHFSQVHGKAVKVFKGTDNFVESYSAFYDQGKATDTGLKDALIASKVTDIFVCGLATDVCVGNLA